MLAICKKELRSCFSNMYGYILIGIYLLFAGFFTSSICLFGGSPSIELSYGYLSFIFLLTVPFLTIKGLSDEKRQKTDILLYSLPIGSLDIVMGKFLSMAIIMAFCQAVGFSAIIVLSFYGKINLAASLSGAVALFLCSLALTSVGLFISTLSGSIVVSVLLSFCAMITIYFSPDLISLLPTTLIGSFLSLTVILLLFSLLAGYLTKSFPTATLFFTLPELLIIALSIISPKTMEGATVKLFSALSITERLETFTTYAIFDLQGSVYFVLFTALFLYFTYLSVEKRRWS